MIGSIVKSSIVRLSRPCRSCRSALEASGRRRISPYCSSSVSSSSSSSTSGAGRNNNQSHILDEEKPDELTSSDIIDKESSQQNYLESVKGKSPGEMAPDLQAFLNSVQTVQETTTTVGPPKSPRLPRHLRDGKETEEEEEEDDFETITHDEILPADDRSEGRKRVKMPIVENMPMLEKIEGMETTRTTNFSTTEKRATPRVYKAGDIVDIYDLLKRRESDPDTDLDEFVDRVYKEYGEKHELPSTKQQEKHKYLLTSTLKYMEVPFLMRDPDGLFDGVPSERVEDFRMFKLTDVPKTTAKLVVQDLSDNRKYGDKLGKQ